MTFFLGFAVPVIIGYSVIASVEREEVPFQYAWRFAYCDADSNGMAGSACLPGPYGDKPSIFSGYWKNISGLTCKQADGSSLMGNENRFTPDDCATGCAYEPSCMAWQMNPSSRRCVWAFKGYSCNSYASGNSDTWPFGGSRTEE